jgi:tetratricopeptide (TPR) repeat protein
VSVPLSRPRRLSVAVVAVAIAAWVFSPQIAGGLVVRGDDFLYRNAWSQAMHRYERALKFDRENSEAADRIAFLGMELRTPQSLHRAIEVATAYLSRRPGDATILADRGLCYLIQRRYALAGADFERAARLQNDPQYFAFAGWSAYHSRDWRRARTLWRQALAIDPHYAPARDALEHLR